MKCEYCDGNGIPPVATRMIAGMICEWCNGTGKEPCHICYGTGRVTHGPVFYPSISDPNMKRYEEGFLCPHCKQSGFQ